MVVNNRFGKGLFMSRSGYSDDCENPGLWRGVVARAVRGKRGQSFLHELATAMDAMPVKELIAETLIDERGQCCTIGVVCKARGLDLSRVDDSDPTSVAGAIGVADALAAEIAYENDEGGLRNETPAQRWVRMRKWVADNLLAVEQSSQTTEGV